MKTEDKARGRFFKIKIVIAGLFLITLYQSWETQDAHAGNYRGPYQGRVVDADTMEPIEGAVVLVEWYKRRMTSPVFYDAEEVLTDSKGQFYIPKKWSWSPWTNLVLDSSIIIFKAGYGHVDLSSYRPDLTELAEQLKKYTPEEIKRMGPEWYFNIQFENDLPIFMLKKLTTKQERFENKPYTGPVPHNKKQLLMQEINKELKALGLGEVTD